MTLSSRRPVSSLGAALLLSLTAGCGSGSDLDFSTGAGGSSASSAEASSTAASASSAATSSSTAASGGQTKEFSFFVTSLKAMQELSGSPNGFGGNLSFGETGPGAGLRGADKICAAIAEKSSPGAGSKPWRAFLSAVAGEDGNQVNAIDRIGEGPWFDRLGRLVANSKADLLHDRPDGADTAIKNDLPNEDGVPNHQPEPTQAAVDNHDTLSGTNAQGKLYSPTATCKDWTSALGDTASEGRPRVGHSWPRMGGPGGGGGGGNMGGSGANWMSALDEAGCAPGVNVVEMGPPKPDSTTVGSGGGYGGIYCFAQSP